ncbi:MAG: 50S ribosomal protein L30 [Chloroflexia bacterium]|nr:50S ribosomal protein L30 [Chloroflexia bacterium]
MAATLRITLKRSTIGRPPNQRATVRSLGLRRINHTVEQQDTPSVRGMVRTVQHLVAVEEMQASG